MASLAHEMTVILEMKHSPAMREFVHLIVRETLRQQADLDLIDSAAPSDAFAKELEGRTVKIEGSTLAAYNTNVTFADTGETVPDVRRVEIEIDAQTGTMKAKLYRWHLSKEATLEHAATSNIDLSTLARVEGVA